MNKIVEYANENSQFNRSYPDVEIGETKKLETIWDGEGEAPEESYSYLIQENVNNQHGVDEYINYIFEYINKNEENILESEIKITGIEII